jgi:hypothetical protein
MLPLTLVVQKYFLQISVYYNKLIAAKVSVNFKQLSRNLTIVCGEGMGRSNKIIF